MTASAVAPLSETAALYDRIAESYQRWWAPVITPAALRLLDLIEPLVADRPRAVIVDLGAGSGTLARAVVARWPEVRAIAVDPSAGMLAVGRAAAARLPAPARRRLSWRRGTAEQLPLPDRHADIIVSLFALQYVRPRAAGLREAHRILRPGGSLALVTWLANDWPFEPWRLCDAVLAELGIRRPPSDEAPGLFKSLTSAAALVRRAGFRGVRANDAIVEHQWTLDAFVHCALESEDRELLDTLEADTRHRLEALWRERLGNLAEPQFLYRDRVAYVIGRRPG